MGNSIDLTGQRFNRWQVIERHGTSSDGASMWLCRCDCGTERVVRGKDLRYSKSKSCGCLSVETTTLRSTKHGHAKRKGHNITYKPWSSMIERCTNPNSRVWKYYGGNGISVCERWMEYENFVADMGERPSLKHSIDRIDTNGNYEPSNCRWATDSVQRINSNSGPQNTSGQRGVSWNKRERVWLSYIGINGKTIRLGQYKNFNDAVQARKEAEIKYHGKSS